MRKWICALACAPFAVCAHDIHPEIGIGFNHYAPQSDGVWYQLGMPHKLNLQGHAYTIGLTGSIWREYPYGIDWHIDYVNLGHIRSTCLCTPLDSNYDTRTHSLVPHPIPMPNAEYDGVGGAQGVKFSANGYRFFGGWKMGIISGLFPYRPQWRESVYGWALSYDQPRIDGIHRTPLTWRLGEMVGISMQHGAILLSMEHYWLPTQFDDKHVPALWTQADMFMVSYQF